MTKEEVLKLQAETDAYVEVLTNAREAVIAEKTAGDAELKEKIQREKDLEKEIKELKAEVSRMGNTQQIDITLQGMESIKEFCRIMLKAIEFAERRN